MISYFDFFECTYQYFNAEEASSVIFCDLSQGFNCVDHGVFLAKADRFGFRSVALVWLASYLGGRRQLMFPSGTRYFNYGCEE